MNDGTLVPVTANIADGSGRTSDEDFARFIEISYGSLIEAICECMVAKKQKYLVQKQFAKIYKEAQDLGRVPSGLRSYLLKAE